jgi:hypothetical protein
MNEVVLRLWELLTGLRQTDTNTRSVVTKNRVQTGEKFFTNIRELNAKQLTIL